MSKDFHNKSTAVLCWCQRLCDTDPVPVNRDILGQQIII